MANTYFQIYIQYVFAVKGRQNLLQKSWRQEVFRYMAGIAKGKNQKPIIINGVEDHVHAFIGINTATSIADIVRDIKNNSTNFINDHRFVKGKFEWQDGYGAFSYSHSHIGRVYDYILNQETHHKKKTFKSEYIELLEKFEIPYDERYLFDWIDL